MSVPGCVSWNIVAGHRTFAKLMALGRLSRKAARVEFPSDPPNRPHHPPARDESDSQAYAWPTLLNPIPALHGFRSS